MAMKDKETFFVHSNDVETIVELIKREHFEALQNAVTENPELWARITTINLYSRKIKSYPLHYLCKKKNVPIDLLRAVVSAAPAATSISDPIFASLPIHIACCHDLPLPAIQILIGSYPDCLMTPDHNGNLPIHLACSMSSPAIVKHLVAQTTLALETLNKKRQTPLHMACSRYDVSLEVIQHLLQAYPLACQVQDWFHRFPLHHACMWKADPLVLDELLPCYPEAMSMRDRQGRTPYGVLRMRAERSDPDLQLLRSYARSHWTQATRGGRVMQWAAEWIRDGLGFRRSRGSRKGSSKQENVVL